MKKQYREDWEKKHLKNVKGMQREVTSDKKEHIEQGWYQVFAMVVQDQGGLIDRERGIRRASNIARALEARGPPWVMWNPLNQEIEFLNVKRGRKDTFTRSKEREVSGHQ